MKSSFLYHRKSYAPPQQTYSRNFSGVNQWAQGEMYKGRFSYGRKKFQYPSGAGLGRPKPTELKSHRALPFKGYQLKTVGREGNFELY